MTNIFHPAPSARTPDLASSSGSVSMRDLLTTAWYYRRLALLVFSVLVLLGLVAILVIPQMYSSRARLLTLGGGVYDLQPGDPNYAREVTPLVAVDVELQLLQSSELHRAVLRREVGPNLSPEAFEKQLIKFEDHLKVSKLETGNVIELTYLDRSAQHAARELQALLAAYFERRAEVLTSGRVGFLTAQRDTTNTELAAINQQIEKYEEEHGVVDVQGQINSAVALDGLLRQHQAEADAAEAAARRSADVLHERVEGTPREVQLYSDNSEAAHTLGTMEGDLFRLEVKRADLASRYMATSPFVKQVNSQIAMLKDAIAEEKKELPVTLRTGYNSNRDTVEDRWSQAQATLAGEQARRSVLAGQVSASQRKLNDLIHVNDTIALLTAQRNILADAAKADAEQLEQARVQQNQAKAPDTTNVRVIEAPSIPRRPVNPRLLFLAATLLSAALIAFVTVVVVASLRETFLTPTEAERALRLPVLCDLAHRNARGSARQQEFGRVIAALDSVPTGNVGKTMVLLTSAAEGKVNSVARGLVEALEPRSPGRVTLVHMKESGGIAGEKAWAAARAAKEAEMNINMTMTRIRLIGLFRELRADYDYVVVTAAPVVASFGSLELTTVADLSLLVVNAETTRRPVATTVLAQVNDIGGSVDGLVMTGRRMDVPGWLYHLVVGRGTDV